MKKQFPNVLWISITGLCLMGMCNLGGGLIKHNYFAISIGILDFILIYGFFKGFRWAFWIMVILVVAGIIYVSGIDLRSTITSIIGDAMVAIPMIVCRDYFFTKQMKNTAQPLGFN